MSFCFSENEFKIQISIKLKVSNFVKCPLVLGHKVLFVWFNLNYFLFKVVIVPKIRSLEKKVFQ